MAKKQTPLMRQYYQVKKKHPGSVLLFRLGDFFETFEDDAVLAAQVCGITLTKRNNGAAGAMPLAGFPHHQLDNYLAKLVRAGHRVAICEQLEDPKQARGIVRRGVVEVVTPGVAFNEKLLDTKRNNFVAAIALESGRNELRAGIACADISTGEFFTTELPAGEIINVLESLQPAEILLSKEQRRDLEGYLTKLTVTPPQTALEEWIFDRQFAYEALTQHFKTASLKGYGIDELSCGITAAGVVLHYIGETQMGSLPHIRSISVFNPGDYMALDYATKRNLEITLPLSDTAAQGTLIAIMDKTLTAMGGRLFRKWITRPLTRLNALEQRLQAVQDLVSDSGARGLLRAELRQVGDIERLMSKVCTGRANPRDLDSLCRSLERIPAISSALFALQSDTWQNLAGRLTTMEETTQKLRAALTDEPPAQVGGGSVFREGYSEELDEIRDAMFSGKTWVRSYQDQERESTGIPSLKVGYNNVFGYYLEITHAHKNKVPERYERKQTLTNAERYTTPELKEIEAKILGAEEKLAELERELFNDLREQVAEQAELAQSNALLLAMTDCLQSYAEAAVDYDFCRPQLDDGEGLIIKGGRHPVVERLLPVGESYVPNDSGLDTDAQQIQILTGPNMSGKSSYLRQVGLIVLLAQIGSFVPAREARIGIVDTIFTRVGAQDNIAAGESTFLVEMQEAANILNNATRRSLILLDEVGRGTATFDGISIAWSIAEFIHEQIGAKTLFATHYHELNDLAERFSRIHNYQVEVREVGSSIIFTRKVLPGATDHSFGIHVAEMAGLPAAVTARAREILRNLESGGESGGSESEELAQPRAKKARTGRVRPRETDLGQLSLFEVRDDQLREQIRQIDVDAMTPLQALQTLNDLKKDETQS